MKQLLTHEEIGDRRPSQFLRHLKNLAGPDVPDEFLKTLWTSRLPTHVQTALASQPNADLTSLSDLADAVSDIVSTNPQVASTSFVPGSALDAMAKQIAALTKQVEALSSRSRRSRSKSRNAERHNHSSNSRRSESNYRKFPNCWYHAKFGHHAKKCVKPCDFGQENSQGSR